MSPNFHFTLSLSLSVLHFFSLADLSHPLLNYQLFFSQIFETNLIFFKVYAYLPIRE